MNSKQYWGVVRRGKVEKGLLYKGKPSNAENFFQCMDVLCLLPPLSFVTTAASGAWWWYMNMNPGMRSWGLSLFSGVYSGTTKTFLTLSITSRWNDSIVNKQNEWPVAYICISYTYLLYISSIFFSLSTEDATLGVQMYWHLTPAEKSSIFLGTLLAL